LIQAFGGLKPKGSQPTASQQPKILGAGNTPMISPSSQLFSRYYPNLALF